MAKRSPPGGDDEGGNDGQGERDLDLQRSAMTAHAGDIHRAANFFDVGLHDVHADAAPGDVGNCFRRGEAGHEDQVADLAVGHFSGVLRGQNPTLHRLRPDRLQIESAAIIGDLDVDLSAFVEGAQPKQLPAGACPPLPALPASRCRDRASCGRRESAGP